MIGYNVEKINELAKALADNYKNLGEKMGSGWSSLSSTLEKEWVGPDEVSYETELAQRICDLYVGCKEAAQSMIDNMKIIGENWQNFQKNNVFQEAKTTGVEESGFSSISIEIPTLEDYDIASTVKAGEVTFTTSTNFGLTNGTESATSIQSVFDQYIDGVYEGVKGLYTNLDASQAFFGSELSSKINEYISNVAESLAKLTTCHKTIYEKLQELANSAYTQRESEQAQDVGSKTTAEVDFQGENMK